MGGGGSSWKSSYVESYRKFIGKHPRCSTFEVKWWPPRILKFRVLNPGYQWFPIRVPQKHAFRAQLSVVFVQIIPRCAHEGMIEMVVV